MEKQEIIEEYNSLTPYYSVLIGRYEMVTGQKLGWRPRNMNAKYLLSPDVEVMEKLKRRKRTIEILERKTSNAKFENEG